MKKKTALLILLFMAVLMSVACSIEDTEKTYEDMDLTKLYAVSRQAGGLRIYVDPRIELLSAVQLAADYNLLTRLNFDYKVQMGEYIKEYKNHMAVERFEKMYNNGFSYDAPPTAMLYYENPLSLNKKQQPTDYLCLRAGGEKNLTEFLMELKVFGIDSNFADFYINNIPAYQIMVDKMYDYLVDHDLTGNLDDYYNMEVNSYNLILAPIFHSGGYGPCVRAANGLHDIYGIIGPSKVVAGNAGGSLEPDFIDDDFLRRLIWHEFSHSFVNPTTEKYIEEVNQYAGLFKEIEEAMRNQAYSNWETCVNEHIVRAVTTRLAYIHLGKEAGDKALAYEKSNGFIYIDQLIESLVIYENNKDRYSDFESYYPELIKVFEGFYEGTLQRSEVVFIGPINNATMAADEEIVVITPTNETNKALEKEISDYARDIKVRFFNKGKIVTDAEALEMDLQHNTIIVYGTIEGNLWLSKHKENLPFKIEANAIEADKLYENTNMVFISALPNPDNPSNGMVIYTAQGAEDIVGINSVFHGPTDYVIAKNGAAIKSGSYVKEGSHWSF